MDPITIAALISGGGAALSSIFGGAAQQQADSRNYDLAMQDRADAKLGATDARGTRTQFIPGQGWVTTYGPRDQALDDFYFTQELPELQNQFYRTARMSRQEDDIAQSLLDSFRRIERTDPGALEDLLFQAATQGVNRNMEAITTPAMRSAMRSGSSNVGKMLERLGMAGNTAMAEAGINSRLQAMGLVDEQFNNARANTSNLYNSFASRARSSMAPTSVVGQSPTVSVVGSQPTGYQMPAQNGWANAIGGVSSAIGGFGDSLAAQASAAQTNQLLQSFLGGSGNSFGASGSVNERSKAGGGVF